MSTVEVNKVNPSSGTNLQLGDSGDTITIPAGATFDSSAATNTLPANVVTTDGTQTLTNKSIVATQLTGTITPSDNTVTTAKLVDSSVSLAKLTATGTKDATTFLRGDNSFQAVPAGVTNTPLFFVKGSGSVNNNSTTKLTFSNEIIDTDSNFDITNSRWIPTETGYYVHTFVNSMSGPTGESSFSTIVYKNGSYLSGDFYNFEQNGYYFSTLGYGATSNSWFVNITGNLNSDYYELYTVQYQGNTLSSNRNWLGYKIS
jgi:hypothetical protein